MSKPRVTFGIVNCNRLYYLKSCLESLLYCTESYENKQIIIVDNASVEDGTSEYLDEKESQGVTVIRMPERDPSNEFARGLNTIVEKAEGEYICPLQGDMQFIVKGDWLERYVRYFSKYEKHIGCIGLDAQRKVRIESHSPYGVFEKSNLDDDFRFLIDPKRSPVCGAGDVMYSKSIIEKIYPWNINNLNHEGGNDSETAMLEKIKSLISSGDLDKDIFFISPQIPVSAAIWTDSRGTNARVRKNRRYGDYWPPKEDFKYYEIFSIESLMSKQTSENLPIPIDNIANGIGWNVPKDNFGNWLKNPIRPEDASENDFVDLEYRESPSKVIETTAPSDISYDYLEEWLDDE